MNKRILIIGLLFLLATALIAAPVLARGQHGRHQAGAQQFGPGQGQGPCMRGMGMGQGFGPFWKNPKVVEELGLSDKQIEQLEQLHNDHARAMIPLESKMKLAHLDLQEVMDADRPDANKAKKAVDAVADAQQQIMQAQITHQLAVRQVLTVDQYNKLKTLRPERRQQRRQHRQQRGNTPPEGDQ